MEISHREMEGISLINLQVFLELIWNLNLYIHEYLHELQMTPVIFNIFIIIKKAITPYFLFRKND